MSTVPNQPAGNQAPQHAYIRQPFSDVNARALLAVIATGSIAIADIVLLTIAFYYRSSRAEYTRQVVRASYTQLQDYRAEQATKLNSIAPSPNVKGAYTIPIDRALELYPQALSAPASQAKGKP